MNHPYDGPECSACGAAQAGGILREDGMCDECAEVVKVIEEIVPPRMVKVGDRFERKYQVVGVGELRDEIEVRGISSGKGRAGRLVSVAPVGNVLGGGREVLRMREVFENLRRERWHRLAIGPEAVCEFCGKGGGRILEFEGGLGRVHRECLNREFEYEFGPGEEGINRALAEFR